MEKDDFRYSLSFGDDVFGGPDWKTMVPPDVAKKCRTEESFLSFTMLTAILSNETSFTLTILLVQYRLRSIIPPRAANSIISAWMNLSTMAQSRTT